MPASWLVICLHAAQCHDALQSVPADEPARAAPVAPRKPSLLSVVAIPDVAVAAVPQDRSVAATKQLLGRVAQFMRSL